MSSAVDATVPADNVKVDKALIRQNFQTIKNEITTLQSKTNLPAKLAYDESAFDNL